MGTRRRRGSRAARNKRAIEAVIATAAACGDAAAAAYLAAHEPGEPIELLLFPLLFPLGDRGPG
jgi:hypothetical protein